MSMMRKNKKKKTLVIEFFLIAWIMREFDKAGVKRRDNFLIFHEDSERMRE